ncbi:hypothetical protein [Chamaesiphon minutus]|uniref:Uncharacterized protein n=1 Tax=Chamaesiphon minutus (strain ATCC 27169 / PCC 6605) TaxID=1173020 RepID=K9UMK4_CHAP6|nr:hypothetical protein [Chamaesiphon minutus]AFY95883.1 hypothetical protein Cha6605_4975 [Chamaesiphon minutus PCC 6605]
MLKIWLTWLQPSVGVLGTALVLSSPFCSYAATKPATVRNITKAPTQFSPWSNLKANGTRIDRELLSGVAPTPDLAVRQLAVSSLGTKGSPSFAYTSTTADIRSVANFVAPSVKWQKQSAKAIKPVKSKQVRNSISAALARAINPQAANVPVPGLYIPNTPVGPQKQIVVAAKPASVGKRIATVPVEIGAPTPLSAMMTAKPAVDPFPVVRPELMEKLQPTQTAASVPATKTVAAKTAPATKIAPAVGPYGLDPIATIPPVRVISKAPKTLLPQAATVAPHSLDPIAAIPAGLQRLLGNNINSQPLVASTPVAKVKSNTANSLLAVDRFISPVATISPANSVNLQLATAQAYTASIPKFDIPGDRLLAARAAKPVRNSLVAKSEPQSVTTVAIARKRNYAQILTPTPQQSWMLVDRRNNLGGLILGSTQPLSEVPKMASLLPVDNLKTSATLGLPAKSFLDIN